MPYRMSKITFNTQCKTNIVVVVVAVQLFSTVHMLNTKKCSKFIFNRLFNIYEARPMHPALHPPHQPGNSLHYNVEIYIMLLTYMTSLGEINIEWTTRRPGRNSQITKSNFCPTSWKIFRLRNYYWSINFEPSCSHNSQFPKFSPKKLDDDDAVWM